MPPIKIGIFDGDMVFHRHLNTSSRTLETSEGKPSGIVFGALNSLNSVISAFDFDHVFVAISGGPCRWREALYPKYKWKDPEDKSHEVPREGEKFSTNEILFPQREYVKKNLKHLGIRSLSLPGYEADDCAMGLALLYHYSTPDDPEKYKITLVSDDWDYCQAIRPNIDVFRPITDKVVTHENLEFVAGFNHKKYPFFKALQGDGSDNIPGVSKGLGEAKTRKMFNAIEADGKEVNYATIIEFCENQTSSWYTQVVENKLQYLLNLELSDPLTLMKPDHKTLIEYLIAQCQEQVWFNHIEVSNIIREYELKSLAKILTNPKILRLR